MKVLISGYNFYPELTGIGKYTGEMAEWMQKNGHEVSVICSVPYYPNWEISNKYKRRLFVKEDYKGIKVYRSYLFVPKDGSPIGRLFLEISYLITSFFSFLRVKVYKDRFDIVVSVCPSFLSPLYPMLFFPKSLHVIHIQDLQIDAARKLKMVNSSFFFRLIYKIEKYFLTKAKIVTTISEGMKKIIETKNIRKSVKVIPNWTDLDFFSQSINKIDYRQKWKFKYDDLVFLYSGNLGEKQGLESIIYVANEIKDRRFKFLIVGEGVSKNNLIKMKNDLNLDNLFFYGLQPYEYLPDLLRMANFHLIVQKSDTSDLVLPSKLISILSVGGVPIATALPNSSLSKILKENKIGILCDPDNYLDLKTAVTFVSNLDDKEYKKLSKNAFSYAKQNLDINFVLSNLLKEIENVS